MKQIKITILIDVPEGVSTPDVDYADVPQEPPELVAIASKVFAEEAKYDPDQIVRPVSQGAPGCPQHGAMTRFPAGTNKAGKPYTASWRCAVAQCPTKPIWDPRQAA